MEKKLDDNYTRMLLAILNKSWRQHLTKQQLYGHLPPITKTIQVRRTKHAEHCWRSRNELISDVLLWTPSHGWAKAGRPARTCIQQFCANTGCSLEDLPEAVDEREGWRERVRGVRADGATWWYMIPDLKLRPQIFSGLIISLRGKIFGWLSDPLVITTSGDTGRPNYFNEGCRKLTNCKIRK